MATLTNNTNWEQSFPISTSAGRTISLETKNKFIDKDIAITMIPVTASPQFDGGGITGNIGTTFTNSTTSASDTSGVKIVASASTSRAAVLYNGAVNGWVTKADNTTASAAVTKSLDSKTTYITGVTINTSKNFNITVPNGSTTPTLTFNFAVDANGNVLVT